MHRHVVALGLSQLICWGISFYLIGVFGDMILADLQWSRMLVHGGFSAALLIMGLVSPMIGRLIDRYGGRPVMTAGSLLCAVGCGLLAIAETVASYYAAWMILGLAMRCMLYDAAFASLARIHGLAAQRPIAHITLLGGLAASCFWPIGHTLAEALGWRGAVGCYAGFALLTLPLHLSLPRSRAATEEPADGFTSQDEDAGANGNMALRAGLYALSVALVNGLNSGMSAHMISMLAELGLGATLAVSVASLRGIGQTTARLTDVIFGSRLHPVDLNLVAASALPAAFILGLASGGYLAAAFAFSFAYGAGNGLATITRGTMPLVLFGHRTYGGLVGSLLVPGFLAAAGAPVAFAYVMELYGAKAALFLSIGLTCILFAAAIMLKLLQMRGRAA